MGNRLSNKVAIVTGGGAGIGEAISKKFALEGAKVVVCGLPDDAVEEVVSQIESTGGRAVAFKGDISQAAHARACVQLAVDTYGKLDILINNAGVFPAVGYINEYPSDALDYLLTNNVKSVFMMTKFAIPYLQKTKGCLVNAGSEAGLDGDAQNAPYAGTKGFIHAFTRSIAAEQAQFGVRANVVCPGPIDTSWTHHETSPMTAKMEKQFISATPMGRRGTTEEVANVYLFLASDEASYVTGALYPVDGGITISKGPAGLMADSAMKKAPEGELDLQFEHEGDPVRRPFQSLETEEEKSFEFSQGSNTLRNALIGLSLGAVAVNIASNYWGKSQKKRTPTENAGATENVNPLGAQTTEPAVAGQVATNDQSSATIGDGTPYNEASANQPSEGRSQSTNDFNRPSDAGMNNGNDQGFTNEAATGNND